MGFADAYLLKAGLRESLIQTDPHSDLNIIVTIPVNKTINPNGMMVPSHIIAFSFSLKRSVNRAHKQHL